MATSITFRESPLYPIPDGPHTGFIEYLTQFFTKPGDLDRSHQLNLLRYRFIKMKSSELPKVVEAMKACLKMTGGLPLSTILAHFIACADLSAGCPCIQKELAPLTPKTTLPMTPPHTPPRLDISLLEAIDGICAYLSKRGDPRREAQISTMRERFYALTPPKRVEKALQEAQAYLRENMLVHPSNQISHIIASILNQDT